MVCPTEIMEEATESTPDREMTKTPLNYLPLFHQGRQGRHLASAGSPLRRRLDTAAPEKSHPNRIDRRRTSKSAIIRSICWRTASASASVSSSLTPFIGGTSMGCPIWMLHLVGTGKRPSGPSRGKVGVMGM